MSPNPLPLLYSFRRCPYAMRARLAIASAGITCELREIVLRDKAEAFLEASPKGTVPVVVTPDGTVIEESYDIMRWALAQADPEGLLDGPPGMAALIETNDGPFKDALDHYKYPNRYEGIDREAERSKAAAFIAELDAQLAGQPWLYGAAPKLADLAILPFLRQFSFVDRDWFCAQPWANVNRWLNAFLASKRLEDVFAKYPKWQPGDAVTTFPGAPKP